MMAYSIPSAARDTIFHRKAMVVCALKAARVAQYARIRTDLTAHIMVKYNFCAL